jgi:maltooligosyltrehalose trehalohydrolase
VSRPNSEHVIYELHVGTFTREGTYAAAAARLPHLADLGITTIELMPISAFPGRWGWGYDGVAHFAPYAGYGTPDELRSFIDQAHGLGLSVILDVVYNHWGPSGNYLGAFSRNYFSGDIKSGWGDGPNYQHAAMRDYVLDNVEHWLGAFRFDGLRLDATHAVVDPSPQHIIAEVSARAHAYEPRKIVFAEDSRNDPDLVLRWGVDGIWADDFHHVAHVTATQERDGYYACYQPQASDLATTIREGWLYVGQPYSATGGPRGKTARELAAEAFVYCLENHDQIGNRARGDRVLYAGSLEPFCALSTLLLFLPMTPLLFMGQEWASSAPFCYFTDHEPELGRLVTQGRWEEFNAFAHFASAEGRLTIPDPQAEDTFLRSKLRWEELAAEGHARVLALYRALLQLRRTDPVLRASGREGLEAEARGSWLSVRRTSGEASDHDRLLLINLCDTAVPADELAPLLAERTLVLRSDGGNSLEGPLPAWVAMVTAGRGGPPRPA